MFSIQPLLTRDATILRRTQSPSLDIYGNPLTTETQIPTMCEIQQRAASEKDAALTETGYVAFLSPDAIIGSGDAISVDDQIFEVNAEPNLIWNPLTVSPSHYEVSLRRAGS